MMSFPLRDVPGAALQTMRQWTAVEKVALGAFLFWAACGLAFAPFRVLPQHAFQWGLPPFIDTFVHACLTWGDVVLIVLAAMNAHLAAVRQWGRADAVRWGAAVIIISGVLETVGTLTGYPFGTYTYTDGFGPRIFGVLPMTIPLAWLIVMTSFLMLVRQCLPFIHGTLEAAIVAALATIFDFILEPFAVYIKQYWLWAPPGAWPASLSSSGADVGIALPGTYLPIPITNYVSWWVIAYLLAVCFAPTTAMRWGEVEVRPALLISGMLAIFIVTRLAHGI
ncbi:hypothetical protein DB346_11815 [Verrucomicrobia bacterium LW23]|nr:hypothetical protein DB346_11815 [Verrucomicrobia bacterium LW23]